MKSEGSQSSALLAIAVVSLFFGCATSLDKSANLGVASEGYADTHRKVVRSGELTISVRSLNDASSKVENIVSQAGGFIERSTNTDDPGVWLSCRVPAAQLDKVMGDIGALGAEKRRSVSSVDVTDQYEDLEARLANNIALRDRLRKLLDRATDVEDIVAVEKELTRVQSEVESMQARLDRLRSEVEKSALSVSLQREQVLGPLGYVGYGLWWAFSKLFVIR